MRLVPSSPQTVIKAYLTDWNRTALHEDAEVESQRFRAAMDEYLRALGDRKDKTLQSYQNAKSWEDVLANMDEISRQYNNPSGFSGKTRKLFRKLSGNANSMSEWLVLLPTQSQYGSLIFGGLSLVLGVSQVLECILSATTHTSATTHMRTATYMRTTTYTRTKTYLRTTTYIRTGCFAIERLARRRPESNVGHPPAPVQREPHTQGFRSMPIFEGAPSVQCAAIHRHHRATRPYPQVLQSQTVE